MDTRLCIHTHGQPLAEFVVAQPGTLNIHDSVWHLARSYFSVCTLGSLPRNSSGAASSVAASSNTDQAASGCRRRDRSAVMVLYLWRSLPGMGFISRAGMASGAQ